MPYIIKFSDEFKKSFQKFKKKDKNIDKYGKIATNANIFIDLWNLSEWYAQEFLKAMEQKWTIGAQ